MTAGVSINLAVEDDLSESVLRRAISTRPVAYHIGGVFGRAGYGYLKRQADAFNNAAKACPFLLLTDLDQEICPSALIGRWLSRPKHSRFLLRVAVREIESWLLADAEGISAFFGLRRSAAFPNPEVLQDPKSELLKLALASPRRALRESVAWMDADSGRLFQGPDYNGTLSKFVLNHWKIDLARRKCRSLDRLLLALQRIEDELAT